MKYVSFEGDFSYESLIEHIKKLQAAGFELEIVNTPIMIEIFLTNRFYRNPENADYISPYTRLGNKK